MSSSNRMFKAVADGPGFRCQGSEIRGQRSGVGLKTQPLLSLH